MREAGRDLSPRPHVVVPYPYPSSAPLSRSVPSHVGVTVLHIRAAMTRSPVIHDLYRNVIFFSSYIFNGEYMLYDR